jgi:hypothetical protein
LVTQATELVVTLEGCANPSATAKLPGHVAGRIRITLNERW